MKLYFSKDSILIWSCLKVNTDVSFILGEPDVDYPIFATPPDTGFECGDKADGMYSDVDARCQVCDRG
jgi:hypothetical protein